MWVDTNVHLERIPSDPQLVLRRAKRANVSVIATGTHPKQWKWLSKQYPAVRSYGLHPLHINDSEDIGAVLGYLDNDNNAHIGEIGLDYRNSTALDRQKQYRVFTDQLEIAQQYHRAVIIHAVRSHVDVLQALKDRAVSRFVIHAFSGSRAIAKDYLTLGGYLSLGGHLMRRSLPKVARYCAEIPLDKLLIETNSPDLAPPGFVNFEPMDLPLIGQTLAKLLGIPCKMLASQLLINASTVFDHDFAQ